MYLILKGIKNQGDNTAYSFQFIGEDGNPVDPSTVIGEGGGDSGNTVGLNLTMLNSAFGDMFWPVEPQPGEVMLAVYSNEGTDFGPSLFLQNADGTRSTILSQDDSPQFVASSLFQTAIGALAVQSTTSSYPVALIPGTDGQVLSADSSSDFGLTWINVVNLDDAETITGDKTFTSQITADAGLISFDDDAFTEILPGTVEIQSIGGISSRWLGTVDTWPPTELFYYGVVQNGKVGDWVTTQDGQACICTADGDPGIGTWEIIGSIHRSIDGNLHRIKVANNGTLSTELV